MIVLIEFGKKSSKFNCFNIKNYKLYTSLRTTRKGGGIGVYVHKAHSSAIKHTEITNDFEFILIELTINEIETKEFLLIYRPPNGNVDLFLSMIESHLSQRCQLIILGDININIQQCTAGLLNTPAMKYNELLESFGMSVKNNAITRFNKLTHNHSIIDHVVASNNNMLKVFTSNNILTDGCSDHNVLLMISSGTPRNTGVLSKISIQRTNKVRVLKSIKNKLKTFNYCAFDVESKVSQLLKLVWTAHDENTTTFYVKTRNAQELLPPWTNKTYISMCKSLHNLSEKIHKLKSTNRPTDRLESKKFELLNIKHEYAIARTKAFYCDISVLDVKSGWKILNENTGCEKKDTKIVLETSATRITNDTEIANEFQEYFLSIVNTNATIIQPVYPPTEVSTIFQFDTASTLTFQNLLRQLNISKASGYDSVSPFIWNKLNDSMSALVHEIFVGMVNESVYPSLLKKSIVHPIHKNGSTLIRENYRPISVSASISKVFESEMTNQIDYYMSINNYWDSYQYGFKKNKGCQEAIAKVTHEVSKMLDRKSNVLLLSLDLSKAFDSVNHQILLSKLAKLGFSFESMELIRSFLSDRTQVVQIDDSLSNEEKILGGIAQGSCVGPTLFNIYINDMKDLDMKCLNYRFADDSILIWDLGCSNIEQVIHNINSDLEVISGFYESNGLKLNLSKSKYLIVGTGLTDINIINYLNLKNIMRVETLTYLGVPIDPVLSFVTYSDQIRRKLSQTVGAISILRNRLTTKLLLNFFHAQFQSHLSYCAYLLLRSSAQSLKSLQVLQNRCLKMIYGLPMDFSTSELYNKVAKSVLPIMGLLFYSCLVMVKKSLLTCDDSLVKFEELRSDRLKNIRAVNYSTRFMKSDLTHLGSSIYNCLPLNIKSTNSLNGFKIEIKRYLLTKTDTLISPRQMAEKNKIL